MVIVLGTRFASITVLAWCVGSFLGAPSAWAQSMASMIFDKPVKTEIATFMERLPAQPNLPGRKIKVTVTCSYYPRFVVEGAHFDGDAGSDFFTVPVVNGNDPVCDNPEGPNSKDSGDWGGGLVGVKNDLVVIAGPDTFDDGTGVTIFRPLNHKVVFSDDDVEVDDKFFPLLISINESNAGVEVHYNRVFAEGCSVVAQGNVCVDRFVKQTGVARHAFARCATSYRVLWEKYSQWRCTKAGRLDHLCFVNGFKPAEEREWNRNPTAIAYDVHLFIPANGPPVQMDNYSAPLPAIKNHDHAEGQFTTVGDLIECFRAD
jgi:hypothetical protein